MVSTYFEVKMKYQFGEMPRIECESGSHTEGWIALDVHDTDGAKFYARMGHDCPAVGRKKGDVYVICASFARRLQRVEPDARVRCGCGLVYGAAEFAVVIGEIGK